MRSVQLPVAKRLRISGYALYPGLNKQGLDLKFDQGVSVIAGINGVGKTTLLNLLLRMLLGASSPSKGATRDIGRVSKKKLVQSRSFAYFQDRVADELPDSGTATLTFQLGSSEVTVTRRLKNLAITKVLIDRKSAPIESNADFLRKMAEMSGLSSAYDFHIVVRYVQFFTEERLPLLWSSSAQFELFKMLFVDPSVSSELDALFSEIQAVDTDYRNRTYQYNSRLAKLKEAQQVAARGSSEEVKSQLETHRSKLTGVEADFQSTRKLVAELATKKLKFEDELDDLQLEMDRRLRDLARADAEHIAAVLPSMDSKLQFLMQGLGSGLGCFACGKRGKKQAAAIGKKLREHHCFVCNSTLPADDIKHRKPASASLVRQVEQKIEEIHQSISLHQQSIASNDSLYEKRLTDLRPLSQERQGLLRQIEVLEAQLPDSSVVEGTSMAADLENEGLALIDLDSKRKQLQVKFRAQVDQLTAEMDGFQGVIGKKLTAYAEAYLHERVTVRFSRNSPYKLATGAGQVNVPTFRVGMTSSTHPTTWERSSATSVSESQKEFLDLAFRMTLLDVLAGSGPTMLVMETPEASLDTWFMNRAAELIRRFAPDSGGSGRMLLATSNVNGTTMIPALLGLIKSDGTLKPLSEKNRNRLLNLMELAAHPGVFDVDEAREALTSELARYVNG